MSNEIITNKTEKVSDEIILFRNQSLLNHSLLQQNIFPSAKQITTWEELECLGYNPELSQIEAIVNIKKSTGYSGSLCTNGSPEYVRFFIDYHDGNGFEDLGIASFRAFDISDAPAGPQHPISYMVSKEVNNATKEKFCKTEVLVTLRAVLSWNSIPSIHPNDPPTYGNVLDAEAILKPFEFPIIKLPLHQINPTVKEFLDYEFEVEKNPVDISSFIKLNLEKGVSSGRTIAQLDSLTKKSSPALFNEFKEMNLSDFGINLDELLGGLGQKDFNIDYEQLVCVGLNTAQDTLGAVINIKRPFGYGGNLCKNGSLEYVSFFADFDNNGTFEKPLGTTFVNVNDIQSIPPEGLNYAVFLKTDLSKYLKACNNPQIVRIRAILSWSTPPTNDPEQQVTWGNRMDVLVQLRPKKSNQTSLIYSIGNVAVEEISPSSCLAYPGNSNRGNNRPWGGMITIKGGIDNSGTPNTTKYRVEYSKNGTDYSPVTLKQNITTINFNTATSQNHLLQDPNGWFPYLANHDESNLIVIKDQVLATWPSHDFEEKYYIRVSFTKSDPIANPGSIQHSTPIRIELDNKRYRADNTPNNVLDFNFDVDMKIDGGVCRVYDQGTPLKGELKVIDEYYGGFSLQIQPSTQIISTAGLITYFDNMNNPIIPNMNNHNVLFDGYQNQKFEVDTKKLKKCGYSLRLRGYERTILNNRHTFPLADKYVGFSVR